MCYIRFSHRIALLAGTFAALATATPATAGCNSGNSKNTDLLTSLSCQGDASGDHALAIGLASWAAGANATAIGANSGPRGTTIEGATTPGPWRDTKRAGIQQL